MKFKTSVWVALLGVGFLYPSLGETGLTSFLTDPGPHDDGLWLVDSKNPKIYGSIGPKGISSRWHIAQWGSKSPLSPDWRRHIIAGAWQTKSRDGSTRVRDLKAYGGARRVELTHSTLPQAYGCHTEFDLFLEPNDPTYSSYPQGFADYNTTPPLSALTTLRLKAFQQVVHAFQGKRCPAPFNLAGTTLAVVFVNYHTKPNPPQAFFYQFQTYDSRPEDYTGWFFTGHYGEGFNNWGYSEYYDYYGYTELVPGRPGKAYDINIASRVKGLISSAPGNLDKELSHWKVKGMYIGSILNGEATIRSVVDSVEFLYE